MKVHQCVGKEFLFPNEETVIRVPWTKGNNYKWNELCADVVEVFGLPGNRFVSHPTMDHMDFHFKSKKDADLCRILLSEKL